MNDTRCPLCGKGTLHSETAEFRTEFTSDNGTKKEVVVPEVTKHRCDECGEYILDPASEERISVAQRHALGLLGADDLIAFRKSLARSQEEMSNLLGLGKKTWCRWESNDYFQSEAFDRFLRLLIFVPANVTALELIKARKESADIDLSDVFKYVRDVKRVQVRAEQFEDYITNGPFAN